MFYKKIILLLTPITFNALHAADNPITENNTQNCQKQLVESSNHNPLMSPEVRQKLIDKGYNIIQKLVAQESIEHSIEVFTNAGRNFVESSWLQDMPTVKSIKKTWEKSFNWAYSFISTPNLQEDPETIEKEKTEKRRAFLESIISVVWALADHAARLEYCGNNLIFTLEDPKEVLWKLIGEYAQQCKQNSNGFENSFAYTPSDSINDAYADKVIGTWAIDARFESTSWALPILPYNNNKIIVARLLEDEFNISPAKTLLATVYKTEGIAAWTFQTSDDILSHQIARKKFGESHLTIIREYITQEGIQKDETILNDHSEKDGLLAALKRISENEQPVYAGVLALIAEYMIKTDKYSREAQEAAREYLLFLKKNCGDAIETDTFKIDKLVTYRIGSEIVADLSQLPLAKEISIESLNIPQALSQTKSVENTPSEQEALDEKDDKKKDLEINDYAIANLFNAISNQDIQSIEAMLEERKKLTTITYTIDKRSKVYGRTPLHHAVFTNNLKLVSLLLENGASVAAQDLIGRTPLYLAYQFTKKNIVEKLVEAGSSINTPMNTGESVIHLALRRLDTTMLSYFLNQGGTLTAQKEATIRILHGIVRSAQIKPDKNPLPRDLEIYKGNFAILRNEYIKTFIQQEIKLFPPTYRIFLEKLYAIEEKRKEQKEIEN